MFGSQTHVKLVLQLKDFQTIATRACLSFLFLFFLQLAAVFLFNDEIHFIFYNKYSAYYFIAFHCLNELLSRLNRIQFLYKLSEISNFRGLHYFKKHLKIIFIQAILITLHLFGRSVFLPYFTWINMYPLCFPRSSALNYHQRRQIVYKLSHVDRCLSLSNFFPSFFPSPKPSFQLALLF